MHYDRDLGAYYYQRGFHHPARFGAVQFAE